jgi:hypothetical protein
MWQVVARLAGSQADGPAASRGVGDGTPVVIAAITNPNLVPPILFAAGRIGLLVAAGIGVLFVAIPIPLLGIFGATEGNVADIGRQLLRYLGVSGFFISALTFTGGRQGTGDTKSPLFITLVSQIAVRLGLCAVLQSLRPLQPGDIWLAIVLGHFTRCALSYLRFTQGKWRGIKVEMQPAQPPRRSGAAVFPRRHPAVALPLQPIDTTLLAHKRADIEEYRHATDTWTRPLGPRRHRAARRQRRCPRPAVLGFHAPDAIGGTDGGREPADHARQSRVRAALDRRSRHPVA